MIFQQGVDALAGQSALDSVSAPLQNAVKWAYRSADTAGRRIANALYGTWFGHPLHPAVTTIPIGTWTASSLLDLFEAASGDRRLARCADVVAAVGVAGGVGAILSGLTDWQHPRGEPQRIGLIHGLTNIGGTLLQAASLVLRARGDRRTGQILSGLTYGALLVTAYLGGEMIWKYRIGVNRATAAGETVPPDFVPVMRLSDLPENQLREVDVLGSPVLLVRRGDQVYAMHAICTHLSGRLPQGKLVDDTVQCPLHSSRFALEDGHVVDGPATYPERCLATRVRNGQIEVGPGAGLGRCQHEPVPAPSYQPVEAERVPATP